MKVLAINGSPRREGNTYQLIEQVFQPLREADIECEQLQIGGQPIHGCTACRKCFERDTPSCVITKDCINELIPRILEADALLLGSPVYFTDVTAEMKAFIDRVGYVCRGRSLLRRKLGAAVVAVRRAGALHTFDTINHFFLVNEMMVIGSSYWNLGIGREPGDIHQDQEGLQTMRTLGENLAWAMKHLSRRQ